MTTSTSVQAILAKHPNTVAALPSVDFLQGAKDTVGGILDNLKAGAEAILNPDITHITGKEGSGNFFGTLSGVQDCYAKIKEIKADFDAHDLQETIADGVDLLKTAYANLGRFGISYPVLTSVLAVLPSPHAGGVNKPA